MCGRYGFTIRDKKKFYKRFNIQNTLDGYGQNYNVSPGVENPVIITHSPNQIVLMLWGLLPVWAKDRSIGYSLINARSESVAEKTSFKKAFSERRCLIPMNFFYEPDKSVKPSIPWYFRFKSREPFGVAGVYSNWKDPKSGKDIQTYSLITVPANDIVGKVHPRMPAILKKMDEDKWLNPDTTESEHLMKYLYQYPDDEMESFRVDPIFWKRGVDHKEIVEQAVMD